MILALQIVALISMLTIIFIAVWSFIIANKAYSQMRYQNYLLEKLIHNVTLLKRNSSFEEPSYSDYSESSSEKNNITTNSCESESSKDNDVLNTNTSFELNKDTYTNV